MNKVSRRALHGDGDGLDDGAIEVWVGRWLARLDDEKAEPEQEARKILEEAPPELKPLLRQEIGSMLELATVALDGADVAPGASAGGYRLERVLGRGSAGVVWSATTASGERRAIKFVHALYLTSEEGVTRFRSEVRAARRVEHPSINTLLDTVAFGGSVGLVSAQVGDGTSLAEEIVQASELGEPPNARALLSRLLPVLRGVAALHAAGVLHLDLKPGNLLVAGDGTLLVSDFGLARLIDQPSVTHTSQLLGTPAYMSPEVASGDRRQADERSDVFSLGVTIHEALGLRRPFQGGASHGVLHAILHEEPPPLPGPLPGLTRTQLRRLRAVLARCLEKDPRDRYPSVEELADDVEGLLAGKGVHGRSLWRTARAGLRRHQRAVLTVLVLVGLFGAMWRDRSLRRDITRVLTITNRLDDARRPGGQLPGGAELEHLLVDLRGLLGSVPTETRRLTLQRVGVLLAHRGDNTDQAVNLFSEALGLATSAAERQPLLAELGLLHGRRSEMGLAVDYLVRAGESLAGREEPSARLQRALFLAQASTYVTRFNLTSAGGELPPREAVLALARRALADTPREGDHALLVRLELKVFELAGWSSGDGATPPEIARMLELLEELETLQDKGQPWEIEVMCYVGNVLTELGRAQEAEVVLRRAVGRGAESLGQTHLLTLIAKLRLARARLDLGGLLESYRVYSATVAELERQLGPLNRTVLDYSIGVFTLMGAAQLTESRLPLAKSLLERGRRVLEPSDTVMTLIQRAWALACLEYAMPQEGREALATQWRGHLVHFRDHRRMAEDDIAIAEVIELAFPGRPGDMEAILARIDTLEADLLESPPREGVDWDWRWLIESNRQLARLLLAALQPTLADFEGELARASSLGSGEVELLDLLTHVRFLRRTGRVEQAADLLDRYSQERAYQLPFYLTGGSLPLALQFEVLEVAAARGKFHLLRVLPQPPSIGWEFGSRAYALRAGQLLDEAGL